MGGTNRNYFWILDSMNNKRVRFPNYGSWQITKKLSEKERMAFTNLEWVPSEAHAVYECSAIDGPHTGQTAILKLRIQIPNSYPPPAHCSEGAKFRESGDYNGTTRNEIKYLQKLTEARCSSAPRLLAIKEGIQDRPMIRGGPSYTEEFWVPGGYVVWILMEKLPGQDLRDFFTKFNPQERQTIREAFRKAITTVQRCGVDPIDEKRENVVWDKTSRRWQVLTVNPAIMSQEKFLTPISYIIDFEDAIEAHGEIWEDWLYETWHLDESENPAKWQQRLANF